MLKANDYKSMIKLLQKANYTVFFTGAGISVESGIPPFRGEDGLWQKYNPVFLNTTYFKENPKESWKLIKEIFYDFFGKAKPNTAHYIIAKWEQKGLVQSIITQNIDNLHQEAGSEKVIEFHGTSQTVTCIACGRQYDSSRFLNMFPPSCPHCKGLLKPDFVFFNEPIPSDTLRKSKEAATKADLFILVGTTGEIMPASRLPYLAEEYNANLVEINIQPSKYTNTITDIFLKGKATRVLTELNNFYNHQLNSKE